MTPDPAALAAFKAWMNIPRPAANTTDELARDAFLAGYAVRAPAEASDQETADLFGSVLERSEFANAGRLELLDLMPLVRAILTRLGLAIVRAGAR